MEEGPLVRVPMSAALTTFAADTKDEGTKKNWGLFLGIETPPLPSSAPASVGVFCASLNILG